MAFSDAVQAAITRLKDFYNGSARTAQNPGGFGQWGHTVNFDPFLQDMAAASEAVGEAAEQIDADVGVVAGISGDVTAVAAIVGDVTSVAANTANITATAENMSAILAAPQAASDAETARNEAQSFVPMQITQAAYDELDPPQPGVLYVVID